MSWVPKGTVCSESSCAQKRNQQISSSAFIMSKCSTAWPSCSFRLVYTPKWSISALAKQYMNRSSTQSWTWLHIRDCTVPHKLPHSKQEAVPNIKVSETVTWNVKILQNEQDGDTSHQLWPYHAISKMSCTGQGCIIFHRILPYVPQIPPPACDRRK